MLSQNSFGMYTYRFISGVEPVAVGRVSGVRDPVCNSPKTIPSRGQPFLVSGAAGCVLAKMISKEVLASAAVEAKRRGHSN